MSGVVCRHCGEPIVRYYNQAYKWAHRNGFVTCQGGVTIAGPVPVVPETPERNISASEFPDQAGNGSSETPEPDARESAWTEYRDICARCPGSNLDEREKHIFLIGWDAAVKATAAKAWDEGRQGAIDDMHFIEGMDDRENPYRVVYGEGKPE